MDTFPYNYKIKAKNKIKMMEAMKNPRKMAINLILLKRNKALYHCLEHAEFLI